VDIQIQGTAITDGAFPWTWGNAAGDKIYFLKANSVADPTTYTCNVSSSSYVDLATNIPATGSDNFTWSMKFQAPTIFDPADAGAPKSGTVTLVARKHT
jgi:hypothetical protein